MLEAVETIETEREAVERRRGPADERSPQSSSFLCSLTSRWAEPPVRRLAIVHYTAPPVVGGVERVIGEHARRLSDRGYDVRLVAGRGDCERIPELDSCHPAVESVTRALAAGDRCPEAFERVCARIRDRIQPLLADRDLVIAHNVLTMPFNLPLAHVLVGLGPPLLAWTHDLAWNEAEYAGYRRPGHPYDVLHRPQPGTTYVAISKLRQRELACTLGLCPEAIAMVPNGIDAVSSDISPRTRDLLRRAGCEGAWPLLLVPARITPRKRLALAVAAAAMLRERHPNLRLLVTGPPAPHSIDDQSYATRLKALRARLGLSETVCFLHELGETPQHLVDDGIMSDLYRVADCVLLTSESEGFGIPALEAGRARVPFVTTDIEVLREITEGAAYFFPPDAGPAEVAAAVEKALSAPVIRLHRHVLATYDWARVIDLVEEAIASGAKRAGLGGAVALT
jgi:glycosyltransferase involved in cell wall biosynthesis